MPAPAIASRSTDDVAELSAAVTETVPILANSGFAIITTAIALRTLDWQFLLVIVAAAPIYVIAATVSACCPGRYAAERASMADRARRVLEAIRGRATVRAGMEKSMHDRIHTASWDVVEHGYSARKTMFILQLWMTSVEFVMLGLGCWWVISLCNQVL